MAENGEADRDTDDLSEEESTFRREEFRQKGQVAQSREVTGLLALCGSVAATYAFAPQMGDTLARLMRELLRADWASKQNLGDPKFLGDQLMEVLSVGAGILLPVALIGFIVGLLGSYAQIGSIFSTDPLTPSLGKINPIEGLKRIFGKKHMMDSGVMLGKIAAVLFVTYTVVLNELPEVPGALFTEPATFLLWMGAFGVRAFIPLAAVLLVFAVLDFWVNKHDYSIKLRMTKEEAKREHKEREGDPQIKARVKAIQREAARRRMMAAVKKADVIVTNPTHFAVAIQYDKENMAAPRVVAKGADFLAQKIKKVAADAGVPLVENVPLARTLFKHVKVGQSVPRNLYQAVAEVLAYVYRLKNRTLG
jgi:flagellar biosynthetic protein FlhB